MLEIRIPIAMQPCAEANMLLELVQDAIRAAADGYSRKNPLMWDLAAMADAAVLVEPDVAASCKECEKLQADLDAVAWDISPAMAQARIDQLSAEVDRRSALIARFCETQQWACDAWKAEPGIKELFDEVKP